MRRSCAGVAVLAAVVMLTGACDDDTARTEGNPQWRTEGCSLDVPTAIAESQELMQVDQMMGYPGPVIIEGATRVDPAAAPAFPPYPASIGDLEAQSTLTIASGNKVVFYAATPPSGISYPDFYEAGGITLSVRHFGPNGRSAHGSLTGSRNGDRNQEFTLGSGTGVLGWEDPEDDRLIRPHRVFWTDDRVDYWLRADVSAADVVKLARQIVCSPAELA